MHNPFDSFADASASLILHNWKHAQRFKWGNWKCAMSHMPLWQASLWYLDDIDDRKLMTGTGLFNEGSQYGRH